jgi:lipopolysaccharide biosynthesis regulator YciM
MVASDLLLLLLPVAAASGWWMAKRGEARRRRKSGTGLSSDYYRGLNYLLNEEQDKALEVFLRLMEIDSETIETHFALGGLFRRRGEVERAIRIHQNILARPSLEQSQRTVALLELAKDYMHAGLLDRAESLFWELVKQRTQAAEALGYLLTIYQRENEWEKAVDIARQLGGAKDKDTRPVIAHCYCEIAVSQQQEGAIDKAIVSLEKALSADPRSVRANILLGDLHFEQRDYAAAYRSYLKIFQLDEEFIPEVLDNILACITIGVPGHEFENQIMTLCREGKSGMLIPGLAKYLYGTQGDGAAHDYINEQLRKNPNLKALKEWVELQQLKEHGSDMRLATIDTVLDKVIRQLPSYQCRQCGYNSVVLHWQCPGCKTWSSTKPTMVTLMT